MVRGGCETASNAVQADPESAGAWEVIMDVLAAVIAGLVGTAVISMVMWLGPRMGMPRMAIWELLGSMFTKDGNTALGWIAHFMMGTIFAIIYAALWGAGVGSANAGSGALFGLVHWLAVGLAMGMVPAMHAGMRAGTVQAPGLYMLNAGGLMSFMGGLLGHVIYGVVVALVYGALAA
jgi:hypothetical protein